MRKNIEVAVPNALCFMF